MNSKSINQIAQEEGDTAANEVARHKAREAAIAIAWRTVAFAEGESACTVERIALRTGFPPAYVRQVCERLGYGLH